jgi:hypothetical protein
VFETRVDLLEGVPAELPDHHGDDVGTAFGERMTLDPRLVESSPRLDAEERTRVEAQSGVAPHMERLHGVAKDDALRREARVEPVE